MTKRKLFLSAALAAVAVVASARQAADLSWDFTAGLPPGARLRTCARLDARGLVTTEITNIAVASGVTVGRLTLPEAFRFSAEFVPRLDWGENAADAARHEGVIFDTLYVPYVRKGFNYGLYVAVEAHGLRWVPKVVLGYGDDITVLRGPAFAADGKVVRLAFDFDAGRGFVWDVAGVRCEVFLPRSGPIAQSTRPAALGDRGCSNYRAFDGALRRVSITPIDRAWQAVGILGRRTFVRGEKPAEVTLSLEDFRAGTQETRKVALDTCRPTGAYRLPVDFAGRHFEIAYRIGPDAPPAMPIVLWGCGDMEKAKAIGFNAVLDYALLARQPHAPGVRLAASHARLDEALALGLGLFGSHGYGACASDLLEKKYWRVNRQGESKRVPEVSNCELQALARETAKGNAEDLAPHPALRAVLANTEVVDDAFPSFNTEAALYRRETGREVPPEIAGKTFDRRKAKAKFPRGIVPEDDPILAYYRWWWRDGNGWPRVNSAIAGEFRKVKGRRADFFTFFDPAVRCPPAWGSGGKVDVLNQWVYANPEPMAVGGPVEELFAMAKGARQDVMIMTQLICYRSRIAPMGVAASPEPEWVRRHPKAGFITIAPDAAAEATWTMLAKPVKGILYHGEGTLFETGEETGYCFTNGETAERLKALFRDVVAPLGPMLLKLPRRAPEVAVLESFTSVAMGGPHSWGWSVPAVTFLQRARLDPRVIYEEEILRDGLGGVKVLYLPECPFLSERTFAAVTAFQRAGGLVVADAACLPALTPDLTVPVERFPTPPKSDQRAAIDAEAIGHQNARARAATARAKETMVADAEKFRENLRGRYAAAADSSSADLVTYMRQWRDTPYLFVVNDRRTFGDYVGPWGLTMEKGLPCRGTVYLRDGGRTRAVYELSRGVKVPFARDPAGRAAVPVDFATNDGRLFAFLDRAIASVKVASSVADGRVRARMTVCDAAGAPVQALLPVEIRLTDAAGRAIAGGFYAAENGVAEAVLTLNAGDDPARCLLTCRCLGFSASRAPETSAAAEITAGFSRRYDYAVPSTLPIVFGGESKATAAEAEDYCIWLDIHYADGKPDWGKKVSFAGGTHGWQAARGVFKPKRPVTRISFNALYRNGKGKAAPGGTVRFRNLFLERREGKNEEFPLVRLKNLPFSNEDEVTADVLDGSSVRRVKRLVPRARAPSAPVKPGTVEIWTADAMACVTPLTFPTGGVPRRIALSLARRERESAQILLSAAADAEWRAADLVMPVLKRADGTPLAGTVTWQRQGYLARTYGAKPHPQSFPKDEKWFPDPLLPPAPMRVRGAATQGAWLTVYAAPEAAAGLYTGEVIVREGGIEKGRVPLAVTVEDFALPATFGLETGYALMDGYLKALYPEDFRAKKREAWDIMLDHRLNPDDISRTAPPEIDDLLYARSRGMNRFNILNVVPPPKDPKVRCVLTATPEEIFNDAFYARFIGVVKPYVEKLREHGLDKMAYIYGFDEREEAFYAGIDAFWKKLKRDVPGIPLMTTAKNYRDYVAGRTNLAGIVTGDWYCPTTRAYDRAASDRLRAMGKKVWWYVCCSPPYPYANFSSWEYPPIEGRLLGWMTWRWRADGFLFWIVNKWHGNRRFGEDDTYFPWFDTYNANGMPGDGIMLYPGTHHIFPSITLAQCRDAEEDCEYLQLAAQRAGRARVEAVCDGFIRSLTDFSRDPAILRAARRELVRLITGPTLVSAQGH